VSTLKNRIEKLENPQGSGEYCTHLPPRVIWPEGESHAATVPDDAVCPCGQPRAVVEVVYEEVGHEVE
jgi:hypothetical protein